MAKVEIIRPKPVENTVVVTMTESEARALSAIGFSGISGGAKQDLGLVDLFAELARKVGFYYITSKNSHKTVLHGDNLGIQRD